MLCDRVTRRYGTLALCGPTSRFFGCTQKPGVGDKCSVNIINSLIWVADRKILCLQEKVSVLILDSEKNCVHRRLIQSYFIFHRNFMCTRETFTPKNKSKNFKVHNYNENFQLLWEFSSNSHESWVSIIQRALKRIGRRWPSWCNSNKSQNPPVQQNRRNFWINDVNCMPLKICNLPTNYYFMTLGTISNRFGVEVPKRYFQKGSVT